jgi:hypothetical protein
MATRDKILRLVASCSAYAAVFGVAAFPWLRAAAWATPAGAPAVSAEDGRVCAWILAWVTHILATSPGDLFQANISYPAPLQLASSEHFLSSQILFAPVFLLTGNAVLSAHVLVILSYLLAGLCMQYLLVKLGCRALPAWVAGLLFALGPLRSTANIQSIQYMNFYLPWTALVLQHLRQQPTLGRAVSAAGVLLVAVFSSYYTAVLVLCVAFIWVAVEMLRAGPTRTRFAGLAAAAVGAAVAVLAAFSGPYLARAEHVGSVPGALVSNPPTAELVQHGLRTFESIFNPIELALAGFGAVLVASRTFPVGRLSRMGLLIAVIGGLLMFGPLRLSVAGWPVWFPYSAIAVSPLQFFRVWWRFSVLAAFGTALLAAATLEWLSSRQRLRGAVMVAAIICLISRGPLLAGDGLDGMAVQTHHPIYRTLARLADGGEGGPLLELPLVTAQGTRTEAASMLASTRHWLPLLLGVASYPPPHRLIVDRLTAQLPASDALDELVALTHLRWVLLRPPEYWPALKTREAIMRLPGLVHVKSSGGWNLLRVERRAPHDRWFNAIAAGWRAGHTILGTRIAPLVAEEAQATVSTTTAVPTQMPAGGRRRLEIIVSNRGSAPWPVTVPSWLAPTHRVQARLRWSRIDSGRRDELSQVIPLPRDMDAGEKFRLHVPVVAPKEPGRFELTIGVEQVGSPGFIGPDSGRVQGQVDVIGVAARLDSDAPQLCQAALR